MWDRRTLCTPLPGDRLAGPAHHRDLRPDAVRASAGRRAHRPRLDPYFTGTKFAWLAEHEPQLWSGVRDGALALGTVDSPT